MRLQTVCCDHKTSCSDTTRTPQSYSIYTNNNNSMGNNINYTMLAQFSAILMLSINLRQRKDSLVCSCCGKTSWPGLDDYASMPLYRHESMHDSILISTPTKCVWLPWIFRWLRNGQHSGRSRGSPQSRSLSSCFCSGPGQGWIGVIWPWLW